MSSTQGIKLDEATKVRLKNLSQLRDRSPHWLMKEAIGHYLDREERYEQEKAEDLARWERYQLTGHAISHQDTMQWLQQLAQGESIPCPK
jgi:predicted transcriptional regulator